MKLRTPFFLFLMVLFGGALPAQAVNMDLSVSQGSISFLPENFFVGQTVRIYTTVDQAGSSDTEGTVEFRAGEQVIGSKPISLKAGGRPEEAWINWTPTKVGDQTVEITVRPEAGYTDMVQGNNSVTERVFVDQDTDGDGIGNQADTDDDNDGTPDVRDMFPLDSKKSKDTDGDGIDDSIDSDDDNDGVYDFEEIQRGTSLTERDTDHDGVTDARDAFPTDPKRSVFEPLPSSTGGSSETVQHKLPGRVLALEMFRSTSTGDMRIVSDSFGEPLNSVQSVSSTSILEDDQAQATEQRVITGSTSGIEESSSSTMSDGESLAAVTYPDSGLGGMSVIGFLTSQRFLWLSAFSFFLLALLFFILYIASRRRQMSGE